MSEVYISTRTQKAIAALSFLRGNCQGWLIGHRRGKRCHIEEILSTDEENLFSIEAFTELDRIYAGGIIGLFSNRMETLEKSMMAAFYGKIFLLKQDSSTEPYKAFTVEYDQDFFLSPTNISWDSAVNSEGEPDG
ncbi:hypothetical protein ACFLT9_10560 [Acidobacteriota bacterium]